MANIKETPTWNDSVYLISRNDRVSGGKDGIVNKPLIALANRTLFLKLNADEMGKLLSRALVFKPDNPNYQAKNKRIENVAEPVNTADATTKNYVDVNDKTLQSQINEIQKSTAWGWILLGDTSGNHLITKRTHIIKEARTGKYYNWMGELPHNYVAGTNIENELNAGKPWIAVDNANNINAAPTFFGLKKNGATLELHTGEGEFIANEYDEWFIAGRGVTFSINNDGNLTINL